MNIKTYILALLFSSTVSNAFAQIQSASKCEIIKYLINSPDVNSWFKQFNKFNDSTITFLDPDYLLDNCTISSWKGLPIRVLNKGELIDSIKKYDFHYVIKNRYSYYAIRESRIGSDFLFSFHRGFDNLDALLIVKKKGNIFYSGKLSCGVQ